MKHISFDSEPKGRMSIDDYYLNIAKAVSYRSSCLTRQYGAVVVKDGEIKATGYNGSPRGAVNCCDIGYCKRHTCENHAHNDGNYDSCNSVHAEMNALISASRKDLLGSTLYLFGRENDKEINSEPCPICSRMIINAGVGRVVTNKIHNATTLVL